MTSSPISKSDLGVRTLSAIAMIAVAGLALWLGGWWWTVFVLMVGIGVWFEWSTLCLLTYPPGGRRTAWRYAGAIYCGIAAATLMTLRDQAQGIFVVLLILGGVIATDVGAYAFGRLIGGPKIAPTISPSKTWAGLLGGMAAAGLFLASAGYALGAKIESADSIEGGGGLPPQFAYGGLAAGILIAIVAQAGDFFESWLKRRAGVKDSGNLLPGHGGLFDRVDGLLSVLFVTGIIYLVARLAA